VLRTLRHLAPPVLLSIGAAEMGLIVVRFLVPDRYLQASNNEAGNYLQTLGTIYAVLLAFVVFVVWSQFNDARTYVEREANEILDLFRTAKGLPRGKRTEVRRRLAAYVEAVIDREWAAMSRGGNARIFKDVGLLLELLWDELHAYEPESECTKSIYADMLVRFNDLSDARTNRLTSASLRIPLALKILLYMGAAFTVASIYLFYVQSWPVHLLMTGALAGALSHVLYVVHDLDDCFAGDWQVPREAFHRVRDYIAEAMEDDREETAVSA
jgi:hypothetical protein